MTETRPLQSVEVLTTGALVTPPIIGQQVATCDSLPGPLSIACCAWSRQMLPLIPEIPSGAGMVCKGILGELDTYN